MQQIQLMKLQNDKKSEGVLIPENNGWGKPDFSVRGAH